MLCGNRIAAIFGVADAEMQAALKTEESLGIEKFRSKKTGFAGFSQLSPVGRQRKKVHISHQI